jgi:predicted RNA-binding protein Jag
VDCASPSTTFTAPRSYGQIEPRRRRSRPNPRAGFRAQFLGFTPIQPVNTECADAAKTQTNIRTKSIPHHQLPQDPPANNARNNERERDPDADILKISDEDAAFVLGKGGNTKRKIARVAGAKLEIIDMKSDPGMKGAEIEITGTDAARARAKDYIGYVLAQRTGPVYIDHTMRRDDLSILMVPMDCVGYVMGRGGQVLRDMENEWGTLMFFAKKKEDEGKADADAKDGKVQEILAIFGTRRSRRGAELKVMSAVEHKKPGHFLDGEALRVPLDQPGDGENDDFDYDVFPFRGDEFSYALGGRGSTRKKIAAASNCILEYVAQVAFLAGNERERRQCRDYLDWLLKQREGDLYVDVAGRDDVTTVRVPSKSVGFVTGHKGEGLRSIEASTKTFCFTNGSPPPAANADDDAMEEEDTKKDPEAKNENDDAMEEEDTRPGAEGGRKRERSPEPKERKKKPETEFETVLIFGDRADDREKAKRMITERVRDHTRGGGPPRRDRDGSRDRGGGGGGRKRGRDDSRDRNRGGRDDDRGGPRRRMNSRDRDSRGGDRNGGGRRDRDRSRDRDRGGDRGGGRNGGDRGGDRDRSNEVCRDYSKGRCSRGANCRFKHVDN